LKNLFPEKEISIGATVISGHGFKSKDFTSFGIPVIKIGNIKNRTISIGDTDFFPEHLITEKLDKFFLKNNDVLIAMTGQGSVGRVGKIRIKKNQKILLNQRVGKFITDEKNLHLEYLYQIISSKNYEQILFDTGTGSGQPNLSPELIASVKIPFPVIEIQRKIAKILGTIDELIWKNMQINRKLEFMISIIFKSWFIDFDGQKDFVDSELGKIPKGWKIGNLNHIANFRNGKSFQIENYDEKGTIPVFGSNGQIGNTNIILNKNPVIVIGRVGAYCGSIYRIDQPSWTTDNSIISEPKNSDFEFLYCQLSNLDMRQNVGGSAQPLLTQSGLGLLISIIPPLELQTKFGLLVRPLSYLIHSRKFFIKKLEQIHDSILPQLITGKIRINSNFV
jgi:type I restriction enzyme, S subunit